MTRRLWLFFLTMVLLAPSPLQAQQQEQSSEQKPEQTQQSDKAKEAKKSRRKRVITDLSGFDLLEPDKLKRRTMVAGATRGGRRPVALAPRLGKVYGVDPTFDWSFQGESMSFIFILRDDSQEDIVHAEVTGTSFTYPADAAALTPGKTYFWTVQVTPSRFSAESAPAGFLVVSGQQRKEIDVKLSQAGGESLFQLNLARARVLIDHRVWYDAIATYTDLIVQHPDSAKLFEERGTVYAQLAVTEGLAWKDFTRAEELQHGARK